ncbi:SMP-30/gluconolactonase/LRE family protein [Sulfitobacter sp. D35]|uniref:SMP-30/gluconolactonase/LRE family protein n=1 Tax=Sulfitobacter sp. D35 TaxID=3083252 RepID=UPI00296EA468|nr:SMP-30/gluconolactonase/LRE family protein [Sulfitobacter sp. D35]MDW4496583.1 SMP-30/gluconolactonase/LRE family protein [Sulfitobacter sp. D35]
MRISVLCDVKPLLGEGPVWDVRAERLWFIDSLGRRIYRCTADGAEMRAWTVPHAIGSMALRDGGGAIVALQDGFHAIDFETGELTHLVDPEPDKPNNRLNDGKVDARGRFLCGSMDTGESDPTGALWRLDPDMSLHRLDDGIICSNGPCWSPDAATLYFADSFTGEISTYDYDIATGAVADRRTFAVLPKDRGGAPDGATVDAEGYVWSACVFDGRIHRFAPDGSVDRVIEMPVCKITSLNFGGPNLETLFVTSMAEPPLPKYPGDGPQRGATFRVEGLGVTGRPEPYFAG